MDMKQQMKQTILSPIPSIGELLKSFVYAFTHVNKNLDGNLKSELNRITFSNDKAPEEVIEILQEWMAPLSNADPKFYDLLLRYFYTVLNIYPELKDVNFSGLTRKQAMVAVWVHVAFPIVAEAMRKITNLSDSPDPTTWGEGDTCPSVKVLEWWIARKSMTASSFAKEIEPDNFDHYKVVENSLYGWLQGRPISIKSIMKFYDGRNDVLARWLLLARTWQTFWMCVPTEYKDRLSRVWKARLRQTLSNIDLGALLKELSQIIAKDDRHQSFLAMVGNYSEFTDLVSLLTHKSIGDMDRADELIKKMYDENPLPEITHQLDAEKARFYVLKAEHTKALKSYDKAFEAARYRHGKMAKAILSELLIVESFLGKSKYTKKWSGWARSMGLTARIDNAPNAYFYRFPLDKHYPEANLEKLKNKGAKIFTGIVCLEEEKNRSPDLRNPDRKIAGSGSVPHTQLMNYASFDNPDAIQKLLDNGANANLIADDGGTAILCAIQAQTTQCINLLLPISSPKTLNSRTRRRKLTPLYVAIEQGDADLVQRLLMAGADPNLCAGELNLSPLKDAIRRCSAFNPSMGNLMSDDAIKSALKQMPPVMKASLPIFEEDQIVAMRNDMIVKLNEPLNQVIFEEVFKFYANGQNVVLKDRRKIISLLLQFGAK